MAVLECKDLSKHYGNAPALNHVSLAVEPGRIVGLLGPNGSGKTTLIKLANGLLTPSEGEVLVCDMAPGKESHASVSYLPERTCIPTWMSVKQLLDFYGDFYRDFNRKAAEEMLTHLNIRLTQRIKQMSKGTREKVQLIMVMSRAAKLYHHHRQLQSRGGSDYLHPPDRRCGKGSGRGHFHQSGPGGAPVLCG